MKVAKLNKSRCVRHRLFHKLENYNIERNSLLHLLWKSACIMAPVCEILIWSHSYLYSGKHCLFSSLTEKSCKWKPKHTRDKKHTCSNNKDWKERWIFSEKLTFNYSLSSSIPDIQSTAFPVWAVRMKKFSVNLYLLIKNDDFWYFVLYIFFKTHDSRNKVLQSHCH